MIENLYTPGCIRTVSGRYVDVFDPKPHMFHIGDIAHALSQIPRFAGQLPYGEHFTMPLRTYTVGHHTLNVYDCTPEEHKLAALLHDASEAYLMDIPKPIKERLPDYQALERSLQGFLFRMHGLPEEMHAAVKEADEAMLRNEWEWLMLYGRNSKSMRMDMTATLVRDEIACLYHRECKRLKISG